MPNTKAMSTPAAEAAEFESFIVGWREWAALPHLNIRRLRVKVDTGATSAALHALHIEPFEHGGKHWLRFALQVSRNLPEKLHWCEAPLVDQRVVTDSGGRAEERYTIASSICIGNQNWPLAITLTNRATMRFRMLLGRNALPPNALVQPHHSYLQGYPEFDRSQFPNRKAV